MNEHLTSNIPNSVLMIRPKVFGFNEETAKTNSFQRNVEADQLDQLVLQTFDEGVLPQVLWVLYLCSYILENTR